MSSKEYLNAKETNHMELPFFKFKPMDWLSGRISFQDLALQGAFIQACCVCWTKGGTFKISDVDYRMTTELFNRLVELRFIQRDGDNYSIDFINEQLNDLDETSKARSIAGKLGVQAKLSNAKQVLSNAKQTEASAKQNLADKNKIKNKNKNKNKIKRERENNNTAPSFFDCSIEDFQNHFKDWPKEKIAFYHRALSNWSEQGHKYRNWFTAAETWAARDEQKGVTWVGKPPKTAIGTMDAYN